MLPTSVASLNTYVMLLYCIYTYMAQTFRLSAITSQFLTQYSILLFWLIINICLCFRHRAWWISSVICWQSPLSPTASSAMWTMREWVIWWFFYVNIGCIVLSTYNGVFKKLCFESLFKFDFTWDCIDIDVIYVDIFKTFYWDPSLSICKTLLRLSDNLSLNE